MNKIYLLLILAAGLLAGCHKVTVGYMKTEHAAYPIDSLQIFDSLVIQTEISRLAAANVSLYDSLEYVRDSLQAEYNRVYDEEYFGKWYDMIKVPDLELDKLLTPDSVNHVAEIKDLRDLIAKNKEKLQPVIDNLDALEAEAQEIQNRLDTLDPSEQKTDGNILKTLEEYRLRVRKRVSWTTSEIQGVDGTAPVFYYIAGVWADGNVDADVFQSDLKIKGNGRFEVPYDFKAPAGRYHVSIRIENEGYSRVLDDVFTFIVNPQ